MVDDHPDNKEHKSIASAALIADSLYGSAESTTRQRRCCHRRLVNHDRNGSGPDQEDLALSYAYQRRFVTQEYEVGVKCVYCADSTVRLESGVDGAIP
jgi:hypothetical protein